jgi:hypothetical protein
MKTGMTLMKTVLRRNSGMKMLSGFRGKTRYSKTVCLFEKMFGDTKDEGVR